MVREVQVQGKQSGMVAYHTSTHRKEKGEEGKGGGGGGRASN